MLTPSANQYLRPEYLSPLPTTLDAKKSPLALLAQTCNNIGADTPNAKSLIPPLEKSSSNNSNNSSNKESSSLSGSKDSHREKSTPHQQSEDKSSFKPYESIKKEEPSSDNEKGGFRTPTSKSCSPAISSTGSVNSGKNSPHSSRETNSNNNNNSHHGNGNNNCSDSATKSSENTSTSVTSSISHPTVSASLHSQHNRISIGCGSMFVEVNHHESALPKDHGLSAHLPLGYKSGQLIPGLPPSAGLLNSLSNCTGCTQIMGHGMPMDSMNSPYSHSQGMNGQGGSPLKPGSYPSSGSALSPYVAYARVKTITGGSTLVPICRDPYCTNCQLSMQNAQQLVGATCPSGCTQCNHEKAAAVAAGLGGPHLSSFLPGPNTPVSLNSGIYPHSMLTPRPYVCNWIAGDTYCGKRFSTSEELLQHLRTHTNLSASDSATLSLLSPSLSLSSAGLGACHLHYSMAPSLTSPAGLHRTYPTSLSPVSSLSASRYHPYKPPLSSLGGAPLSPFPPHPSLAASPYFSPYAMYGQRLGTAVHP